MYLSSNEPKRKEYIAKMGSYQLFIMNLQERSLKLIMILFGNDEPVALSYGEKVCREDLD